MGDAKNNRHRKCRCRRPGADRWGTVDTGAMCCQVGIPPALKLVPLGDGLTITARHPVRIGGVWKRPHELQEPSVEHCGCVYNLVLEGNRVLLVNGIECVTFGHGITEGVAAHSYYVTQRVVEDLASLPGW